MDHRAGRTFRLARRADIARVFEQGRRAADGSMTLVGLPNDLPHSRCGVGVSWRHGGAVRRNRVKRLCREAFRLTRESLPAGWDYMMLPRPGRPATLDELRASLRSLADRLARQAAAKDVPP